MDDVRGPGRPESGVTADPVLVCAIGALARGQTVAGAAGECNISVRSLHRLLADARAAHQAGTTVHLAVKFVRAGLI